VHIFVFPPESAAQTSPDVPLPDVGWLLLPLRPEPGLDRKAFKDGCFLALPPTDKQIGFACLSEFVSAS